MGTNYYAVVNRPSVKEHIHIGKSSSGYKFLFQRQDMSWSDPPVKWETYDEVKSWLKKYTVDSDMYVIMDEYDDIVSYESFIDMVDEKQKDDGYGDPPYSPDGVRDVNGYRFEYCEFC